MTLTGLISFETELGWIGLAAEQDILERVSIGHQSRASVLASFDSCLRTQCADDFPEFVELFQSYCNGTQESLSSIQINERWMTPFQKKVVDSCRQIPWGETLTYGQLAIMAGSPRASRAVGTVMSQNRFPLVVPCHRVRSSSGMGGFSAPSGVSLKRKLWLNEGIICPDNQRELFSV